MFIQMNSLAGQKFYRTLVIPHTKPKGCIIITFKLYASGTGTNSKSHQMESMDSNGNVVYAIHIVMPSDTNQNLIVFSNFQTNH